MLAEMPGPFPGDVSIQMYPGFYDAEFPNPPARLMVSTARRATAEEIERYGYQKTSELLHEAAARRGYRINVAVPGTPRPATDSDLAAFGDPDRTHPNLRVRLLRLPPSLLGRLGEQAIEQTQAPDFVPGSGREMELVRGVNGTFIDLTVSDRNDLTTTKYDDRVPHHAGNITAMAPVLPHVDNRRDLTYWETAQRSRRLEGRPLRLGAVLSGDRRVLIGDTNALTISDAVFDELERHNPNTTHTRDSRIPHAHDFHAYVTHRLGRITFLWALLETGEAYIVGTENLVHDGSSLDCGDSSIGFWLMNEPNASALVNYAQDPALHEPDVYSEQIRHLFFLHQRRVLEQRHGPHQASPLLTKRLQIRRDRRHEELHRYDGRFTINPARSADIPSMVQAFRDLYTPTYRNYELGITDELLNKRSLVLAASKPREFESIRNEPNSTIEVAHAEDRNFAGFIIMDHKNYNGQDEVWLDGLFVPKPFQGYHVAHALLLQALSQLSGPYGPIHVAYAPYTPAEKLYGSWGFAESGRDVSHLAAVLEDGKRIPLVEAVLPEEKIGDLITLLQGRINKSTLRWSEPRAPEYGVFRHQPRFDFQSPYPDTWLLSGIDLPPDQPSGYAISR